MLKGSSGFRPAIAVSLITIVGLLTAAAPAEAGAITVTRFDDPAEDGCGTNGCSLREAVQLANGVADPDTIVLGAGTYVLTQPGFTDDATLNGDLDVTDPLSIQGAGSAATIIDGEWAGPSDRILHVLGATADLTLLGLTIQDGNLSGIGDGGGILVEDPTSLTATDLVVRDNKASFTGGIDNYGTATLTRASFIGNAGDDGSGSGCCGGFYNESGSTATMTDVSFIGNTALDDTGALYSSGDSLTITNALFSGNTAGEIRGGAMIATNGTLSITNATFSGNSISGDGDGGAIANEMGSTTNLNNVTITGNSVTGTGDGGGIYRQDGTLNIRNSIIAGNTDAGGQAPDCGASMGDAFTSGGHNLIGSTTGCTFTPVGDLSGVSPLLGPLADNGGLTQTHALLAGSPAIDAGGTDCAGSDQRGLPRGTCDIGAYELVLCRKVAVNRIGTEGNDSLTGSPGRDGILALGGRDTLRGKGGNDGLCGGPGKDTLRGGGGKDRLDGGPGKDLCVGQAGRDKARACENTKSIP